MGCKEWGPEGGTQQLVLRHPLPAGGQGTGSLLSPPPAFHSLTPLPSPFSPSIESLPLAIEKGWLGPGSLQSANCQGGRSRELELHAATRAAKRKASRNSVTASPGNPRQPWRPEQPKRTPLRLQLLRGLRAVAAEPRYSNRSLRGASRSLFSFLPTTSFLL